MRLYSEQLYCFLKAWNGLDGFHGDAKISTWLSRIAINESLDLLRRNKQQTISTEEASVANSLMADRYFDGSEIEAQLQEAVASLPDVQRTVFQLRYFEEMKYSDMSQLLNTSEKYIEERVGKRNPFQVPEGYFDSFADRMMQQLPERSVSVEASPKVRKPALMVRMRPWLYAAACALVLVVSVWMWQSAPDTNVATQPAAQLAAQQEQTADENFDEAADYMMLDNQDIYTYLAEN